MQASLAALGGVLGLAAWLGSSDWRWLLGAVVLLANWPFTLVAIRPTNDRLMATAEPAVDGETRRLMERWAACTPCAAGSASARR